MKLLFTGKGGKAGSWIIRGEQVGAAIGATVTPNAVKRDIALADMTVVVKRTPETVLQALRKLDAPWVYDVVDAYPQPQASRWTRGEAIRWIQAKMDWLNPTAVIWPNQKMREDCDSGLPGIVLPHHHRPGIRNNPIREKVQKVGYEGGPQYLGEWEPALQAECSRRGWEFVKNPDHLADLDIVVAMRGGDWAGYVPGNYKSAVKLANAHASGTPFVGQQEAGYMENATGCEYWADKPSGVPICFDWLEDQGARELIHDRFVQAAFPVEHAAEQLKRFLHGM
jgi:hypothetical protein